MASTMPLITLPMYHMTGPVAMAKSVSAMAVQTEPMSRQRFGVILSMSFVPTREPRNAKIVANIGPNA